MFPTILMALGFVNGLILGGILMNLKSNNPLATKLFAWVVLLFALSIGQELMEILGLHYHFPHLLSSTDGFLLLIFPLLYLYALVMMGKKQKLTKKDLLHALPFLAFTIHLLPYYALSSSEKLNFQHDINFELLAYLKAIPVSIYLILTTVLFFKTPNNPTKIKTIAINIYWFKVFIFLLSANGIFSLFLCTYENFGYHLSFDSDTITSSLLSVIIYGYSFLLIKKPMMLLGHNGLSASNETKQIVVPAIRYRNSPLSREIQQRHLAKIKQVMEQQRLYLNPNLTPVQLAEETQLKPHYLSQIFNELLNKNFYNFVNEYRVTAVKRLIADPNQDYKTLLALGLESGFNSKSSFNRIFKEHTGLTPSQYKKQIQLK